ncbi:MAG: methyltransferase domain-containing protein [Thermodesulfobacteriota bacterium]|nr:methyltransferase domain-containing protein [Thermodesulfobacteriota bacterium]
MDWSRIQQSRNLAREKFPRILKLPVVPDQFALVLAAVDSDSKVLDVGANNRRLERKIAEKHGAVYYKSLDIDRNYPHDYYDIREVNEKFSVIACLDVVEHISVPETFQLLGGIFPLLEEGGLFFISTPNVSHPNYFWRDCTHRTAWRYNELAGVVCESGFGEVSVFRVGELDFKGRITYLVFKPLIKMLDMDYATSIMIRAKK